MNHPGQNANVRYRGLDSENKRIQNAPDTPLQPRKTNGLTFGQKMLLLSNSTLCILSLILFVILLLHHAHKLPGSPILLFILGRRFHVLTTSYGCLFILSLVGFFAIFKRKKAILTFYVFFLFLFLPPITIVAIRSWINSHNNVFLLLESRWNRSLIHTITSIQKYYHCCGFWSPVDADNGVLWNTGCSGKYMFHLPSCHVFLFEFAQVLLPTVYAIVFFYFLVHLVVITITVLYANHIQHKTF